MLPEKTIAKSPKKRRGAAKLNTESNNVYLSDSGTDVEIVSSPGVGQKTAYKKLSKLKRK